MAGSRDVLNAFRAHVARLVECGRAEEASEAWADFVEHVVPSFPEPHRAEALALRDEFEAMRRVEPRPQPGAI
jgi:hypothetical protein